MILWQSQSIWETSPKPSTRPYAPIARLFDFRLCDLSRLKHLFSLVTGAETELVL